MTANKEFEDGLRVSSIQTINSLGLVKQFSSTEFDLINSTHAAIHINYIYNCRPLD